MSNWITDNKPAATVAGVGLLLFLGLSVAGYMANSERSDLDKKIKTASQEIKSANAAPITPSRTSNKELEKELNRYAKAIGNLETAYKPFMASSVLTPTTPTAFQNEMKAINSLVNKLTDCGLTKFIKVYRSQLPIENPARNLEEEED